MKKSSTAPTVERKLPTPAGRSAAASTGNGSTTSTAQSPLRERDIEAYLCHRVKALGGEVRKLRWVGRNGAPDRLVMLLLQKVGITWPQGVVVNTNSTIWVELKAPGKKPEPHQLREHKRMRAMGQRVVVIDSLEGVDDLLA